MALGLEYIILGFAALCFVAFSAYLLVVYSSLSGLKRQVEGSWSEVDALLRKRIDELPYLLAAVRDYMAPDDACLLALLSARDRIADARSPKEKAAGDEAFMKALKVFFSAVDSFPEMKAKENYIALERRLASFDGQMREKVSQYNDGANIYNTRIHSMPDSLVAGLLRYTDMELYRA